jgi:hypothetical protein
VIPFYYGSGSGSETVINYGSGSDFLARYGFGSARQKVTVPKVPVPQRCRKPSSLIYVFTRPLNSYNQASYTDSVRY